MVLGSLLAAGAAHQHVVGSVAALVFPAEQAPPKDVIVVPGARIHGDGRPYALLEDRLATALELFQQGRAPRIVVSGLGGGGLGEDEVGAMRRWLMERGVSGGAIVDDPLGLRSIDTLRRLPAVAGTRSALVVTNGFHLPRMLYLGRGCGLDVAGVAAAARHDYSRSTRWRNEGRELLARLWAFAELNLGSGSSGLVGR